MQKVTLVTGLLNAALVVGIGAFGAHALKACITSYQLDVLQVGIRYHMFHALGLIFVALIMYRVGASTLLTWSALLLMAGIVLFSGSLYGIAFTGIRALGMISPFGGTAFIVGWILAAIAVLRGP